VIQSIHSFTQSSIGPWLLGFICVVTVASLALVFSRLPLLRAQTRLESLVSREATFLYNNLLLVALCLTILWGVVYPLVSEALRGETVSVSGPYYNFFLRVFGLPLLALMGLGPLVAWRRASLRSLARTLAVPAGFSLTVGLTLVAFGGGSSRAGLIAYTFSAFVLGSIAVEFARGTRARQSLTGGSWGRAFSELVARNRRRYGGYVVHAAIVMLAIGVAGSSAYDKVREQTLRPGESTTVGAYELKYLGAGQRQAANARELRAFVAVSRSGRSLATLQPGKNFYPAEGETSNEMAIRTDWLRGEDLDLIAQQVDANGTLHLKALVKPLVNLIWLAGAVFVVGSVVALWPDAREERRLALRYGRRPLLVEA
jgi:cytochrome c-type biogenesis protein CcmF